MGSGSIMMQVLEARQILEEMNISTDVWSVTSYTELQRDALDAEREGLLTTNGQKRKCYVETLLEKEKGVFVSASDYVKSLGMSIAKWMPKQYHVLGTDGYGFSEARNDLRDHFEISAKYIVLSALQMLREEGAVTDKEVSDFLKSHKISSKKVNPATL